ncbi:MULTISPECIES: flavin reductase family protein [unclassified Streptomyces]|uniref:flavin reductase family protein n=1 Tax=unclassified Streptomyces TaxID=2593676 RepID=UPI0035D87CD0
MNQVVGDPPEVLPEAFRDFFQGLPAAATVVTASWAGRPHATTVSAFCSLSLDPPLVLIALGIDSRLLGVVRRSGRFAVHLLDHTQHHVATQCASKSDDKLARLDWEEKDGLPVIREAAGWMACDVDRVVPAGDHDIVLGRPRTVRAPSGDDPLLYYRRQFRRLDAPAV